MVLLCASEKEIEFHLIIFSSGHNGEDPYFTWELPESLLAIKLFVDR